MFPWVPITVRNKVPAVIFLLGTSFLSVIFTDDIGEPYIGEIVARKKGSQ
jgi:hypothetical protein